MFNPFPHTTNLQQTTLKICSKKIPLNERTITELRVENMLTKEEIASFEQFLILSECFQKSSAAEAC